MPPCFSKVNRISSLLPYCAVDLSEQHTRHVHQTSRPTVMFLKVCQHTTDYWSCMQRRCKIWYLLKRQAFPRNARFHWGIWLHVWTRSLLKLKTRPRVNMVNKLVNSDYKQTSQPYKELTATTMQLTSDCAKLSKFILWCYFQAVFQRGDPCFILFLSSIHGGE